MRIISQNNLYDLNYDNLEIEVYVHSDGESYINYSSYNKQGTFNLGKYSSEEKALKVMEMIRYQYLHLHGVGTNQLYFHMPQDE